MDKKYQSIFSPGKEIEASQYIIELLCRNKASSLKKSLPIGFTNLPEWQIYFKSQLKKCHEYLGIYHPDIIIKTISQKKIYSLFPKWIKDEFDKEHERTLNTTNSILNTEIHTRITNSKGRKQKDLDLDKFDG